LNNKLNLDTNKYESKCNIKFSVEKCRTPMQTQVSKFMKEDKTMKDIILSTKEIVSVELEKTDVSDH